MLDADLDWRNDLNGGFELAKCRGGYDAKPPESVFRSEDWVMELKLDGIRKTVQFGRTKNWLVSRSKHNKLKGVAVSNVERFVSSCTEVPWLSGMIQETLAGTMLDGELVVDTSEHQVVGATMVGHLASAEPDKLKYVAFDVLFWKGVDVRGLSWEMRRTHLLEVVAALAHPKIEASKPVLVSKKLAEKWFAEGAEGVILKDRRTKYLPRVQANWWKYKAETPVDGVVIDVSEGTAGGSPTKGIKAKPTGKACRFKVALWKDGKLTEVGWVGNLPVDVQADGLSDFKTKYYGRVVEFTASGWDGRWFGFCRFK